MQMDKKYKKHRFVLYSIYILLHLARSRMLIGSRISETALSRWSISGGTGKLVGLEAFMFA